MNRSYLLLLICLCLCQSTKISAAIFDSNEGIIEIYFNRSDIDGNRILSLEEVEEQLDLSLKNADSVNIFYSYLALSLSSKEMDKSLMIDYIIKAYSFMPQAKREQLLPYLKLAESISYYHLGNPKEALKKITILINEKPNDINPTLNILIQLHNALYNTILGDHDQSRKILNELDLIIDENKSIDEDYKSFLVLNINNVRGLSFLLNKETTKAEETILTGISMAEQLEEKRMLVNFQGNLSNIYFLQKRYSEAINRSMIDFNFSLIKDNKRSVFGLAGIIAESYFNLGKIDSTEKYIRVIFDNLPEINEPIFIDSNLAFLLDYYNNTKQFQKLLETTKQFNKIKDSIAQVRLSKDYEIIKSQLELEKAQSQINQLTEVNLLENQRRRAIYKYNTALVIGILAIILLAIFIYRNLTQKQKQNRQLEQKNTEINNQNEELKSQQETLKTQAEKITELNTLLEQKVSDRTKELLLKNKKLEDYAHYNSHNIRGPLARILGLIHLWESENIMQSEKEEMLSRIEQSAKELDEMVRKVNQMLE